MAYVALPRFLFRAPLLPVRALGQARRQLNAHPLGATALELASPALAAAVARAPRAAATAGAVERYARRAAFRPTPHGLWAGVGVGGVAVRTHVQTGVPVAHLAPSWARLAALGRALLDRPVLRLGARLRRAPSLTLGAHTMTWLGPGAPDGFCEQHTAELDEALETVVLACGEWTEWAVLRATAARVLMGGGDDDDGQAEEELDDWLLTLVDDGALLVDTVPPLLGPPADVWMTERLARLPAAEDVANALNVAREALRAGALATAVDVLGRLPQSPGDGETAPVQGTLLFPGATAQVTLSRAAIARAAAIAPLLFRLQEALTPPAAERTPGRALAETLDAATEIFGAGALELPALARGDYGADPSGDPDDDDAPDVDRSAGAAVVAFLTNRIMAAARGGDAEVALRAEELAALLPDTQPPATCELFLTPCRQQPKATPGAGWLLGLHAPAGASWGRFAGPLAGDQDAQQMFADLKAGERWARPDEEWIDVAFAPSARVADLCAHPPLRDAALALTDWPAEQAALTLEDLELVADPAALTPLALRRTAGAAVTPSPLHRVRSTTAPRGVWKLLVGWSLHRQHAPWAMAPGPLSLGTLDWLPRVRLDGFVIAPASWRVPAGVTATARRLEAWRRAHRVPRHVQVGHEDELLPLDLAAPGVRALLRAHDRVHEIWPPLGDTPDRSGRRIEAVIGLVDRPDPHASAAATATRQAGAVPPPAHDTAAAGWLTFKLFGAADRQDAVLADVVAPLVAKARRARSLGRWFFQRYVEGPGRRPHVRLRFDGHTDAIAHALEAQLTAARRAGDVVSVERAPYFPEAARFGGASALPAVHALFQAASELALDALTDSGAGDASDGQEAAGEEDPRLLLLIGAYDALARAAGLDAARRRALAQQRRDAHAASVDEDFARDLSTGFRRARPALRAVLGGGSLAHLLAPYERAAAAALAEFQPQRRSGSAPLVGSTLSSQILPTILHLDAVRLMGPDRDAEIRAYTYWERALESLERHSASAATRPR